MELADYSWRFKLGDPPTALPPLSAASNDTSFDVNVTGLACSQLAYTALGRMGTQDCRGACASTAGCKAWQFAPKPAKWNETAELPPGFSTRGGCYIHDGTLGEDPQCSKSAGGTPFDLLGERRTIIPPAVQMRKGVTWATAGYDDSAWAKVDVPHDFVVAGAYAEWNDRHHGYLPRDRAGWYRKTFRLPKGSTPHGAGASVCAGAGVGTGGAVWLHFEGVFQAADVWVNGVHTTRHTSGYLPFEIRLDTIAGIQCGNSTNVIAIRVDASFGSGHWYEGGGLSRRVWMYTTAGPARFVTDGLFAQTAASSVSAELATVVPTAEVVTTTAAAATVTVRWTLRSPAGTVVATATTAPVTTSADGAVATITAPEVLRVPHPARWSVRTPVQYTLTAELFRNGGGPAVDLVNTTIGIRAIDWNTAAGFALNDDPVHIRGFSHHSDFGGVGAAVPDRINLFRAQALRAVGGNTWRTSHNPYRPAVYDILDAVGVLVWDENRDFNQLNGRDMEQLVRRDRNHPSVVIWSACNEVECWVESNANITGKLMREAAKKWDTTRPFSANLNQVQLGGGGSGGHPLLPGPLNATLEYLAGYLDVEGFSHGTILEPGAAIIHQANPTKAVVSSECCSCQSQRGEDYANSSLGKVYVHDKSQAECMARCMAKSYPFWKGHPNPTMGVVAGTLGVWTLFDYGGEPGPWPTVSSSFGQFDLAGFPKSASYWYRANWLAAVPTADAGRPPVPETHVVRISQAWSRAPPPVSYPPVPTPDMCNRTLFQSTCPVTLPADPAKFAGCIACCKANSKVLMKNGCKGNNVWPDHCRGEGPGFPNRSGVVDVQVFSDAAEVELFLNGESQGTSPNGLLNFSNFDRVPYAAGNLTAVGRNAQGAEVARHTLLSARGVATAVVLSVDVPSPATGTGKALLLDGHDAALIRATLVDADGRTVGEASDLVTFAVTSGPGKILGVHNGDATSVEAQVAASRHAYHGLVRAVVGVTVDNASVGREHTDWVDAEHGDGVDTVKVGSDQPSRRSTSSHAVGGSSGATAGYEAGEDIVIRATAAGLTSATIRIATSPDAAQHAPLAVAAASVYDHLQFE
jgi:hypothetical protein